MNSFPIEEFSLWLEPTEDDSGKITSFLSEIQKMTGNDQFSPHVTLLNNIPLSQKEIEVLMQELRQFPSLKIDFIRLKKGENYWKNIFLECAGSKALLDLNQQAQHLYKLKREFKPHMSLIYSHDHSHTAKIEKLINQKGLGFFSFEVKKVSLWHAKGSTIEWKKVAEIPLKIS